MKFVLSDGSRELMCAPLQVNNRVALFVVLPPEKKRVSLRMRSAAKGLSLTPHDCGPKVRGTCVLINGRLECKDLGGGFVGGNCQITSCSTLLGDQCPGGGQE